MILSIETSTAVCSVALNDPDKLISIKENFSGYSHAEKLVVFISGLLQERKIQVRDLDAIAVSVGPGSYTGLRIGMSAAKGLCFSQSKPLICISTLEALAFKAIQQSGDASKLFCPMIDARRMEVYTALYSQDLICVHPPSAIIVDDNFLSNGTENKEVLFFGDGAEKCKDVLRKNFIYFPDIFPSAEFIGQLAWKKFKANEFSDVSLAEPLYLKEYKSTP
jgi:tRNA threonylcarbamoyladenosine biosynthesis protein TsaB